MTPVDLTMTEAQHRALRDHLFPPDDCEAVAIALCGRAAGLDRHRLLVRKVELVPYSACAVRRSDRVTWPTSLLVPLLEEAAKHGWAIVKLHGHRGFDCFSAVDDASDRQLFPSLYAWMERDAPHASVVLMDDGRAFGRVVTESGEFVTLRSISIVGDNIAMHRGAASDAAKVAKYGQRVAQTFGTGTYEKLRMLRAAVVGCSGTGSPVIEQLARNCVGGLILVDPDHVEEKNLNRILNTTADDAARRVPKVEVARRAVESMGLGTQVQAVPMDLFNETAVRAIASCDVVFGCMDTIDGRFFLNKLASYYSLPYFDLGVRIEADGTGGVHQVCGTVHYIKPGGSSLLSRNTFTLEQVRAAGLRRTSPNQYKRLLDEGYLRGSEEDRPAVIQLNSLIASLAINEFLARLHPYRLDGNADFAINRVSLSHSIFDHEPDGEPCPVLSRHVGKGDVNPLLDWPELSGGACQ